MLQISKLLIMNHLIVIFSDTSGHFWWLLARYASGRPGLEIKSISLQSSAHNDIEVSACEPSS